jgi:hypothetical protein
LIKLNALHRQLLYELVYLVIGVRSRPVDGLAKLLNGSARQLDPTFARLALSQCLYVIAVKTEAFELPLLRRTANALYG